MNFEESMGQGLQGVALESLRPFGVIVRRNSSQIKLAEFSADHIQALLKIHKLVVLRGFDAVEKDTLVNYATSFGSLLEWDFGNVMEMMTHESPKNYLFTEGHVPLHWDGAFHREPRFLLFHCVVSPNKNHGGETFFSNTEMVFSDLSRVEVENFKRCRITYETEKLAHYGGKITVPVVQDHPHIHAKIMRFAEPVLGKLNPVSAFVENASQFESEKIMQGLASQFYDKKYLYTHAWENNDFLISDNYALLHGRNAFSQFSKRHLRRIQIV